MYKQHPKILIPSALSEHVTESIEQLQDGVIRLGAERFIDGDTMWSSEEFTMSVKVKLERSQLCRMKSQGMSMTTLTMFNIVKFKYTSKWIDSSMIYDVFLHYAGRFRGEF